MKSLFLISRTLVAYLTDHFTGKPSGIYLWLSLKKRKLERLDQEHIWCTISHFTPQTYLETQVISLIKSNQCKKNVERKELKVRSNKQKEISKE